MKFRKKPVVIEAWKNEGDQLPNFLVEGRGDGCVECCGDGSLLIHTLEGTMRADNGDWIIKDVNGEFYPCKPDIFEKTYEPEPTTIDPYCEDIHHRQVYVGDWLTGGGLPDRPVILSYPFQIAKIESTNVCIDQHGLRHNTNNYEYIGITESNAEIAELKRKLQLPVLPCGHMGVHLVKSVESDYTYCNLCEQASRETDRKIDEFAKEKDAEIAELKRALELCEQCNNNLGEQLNEVRLAMANQEIRADKLQADLAAAEQEVTNFKRFNKSQKDHIVVVANIVGRDYESSLSEIEDSVRGLKSERDAALARAEAAEKEAAKFQSQGECWISGDKFTKYIKKGE